MEVFVTIAIIVTVIMMSYRKNSIERKKNKLWLEHKTGRVYTQKTFFCD